MRKTLKKKTGNESNVNIAEMDQKNRISLFAVFEGFTIILEKQKESDQKSLFGPFPC